MNFDRQWGKCKNLITGKTVSFTYDNAYPASHTRGHDAWVLYDVRLYWRHRWKTIFPDAHQTAFCMISGENRSALFRVGMRREDEENKLYIVEYTPLEMSELIEEEL